MRPRPVALTDLPPPAVDRPPAGHLNADLARAVVRVHRQYTGRGPTKAQAFYRQNVVVVVLQEVLTRTEQSLENGGHSGTVLHGRRQLQAEMEPMLVEAVQELTGCKVTAFMSDNHVAPDVAVEIFMLDRPVPATGAAEAGW
jgi:uncharacterized protein YbcI